MEFLLSMRKWALNSLTQVCAAGKGEGAYQTSACQVLKWFFTIRFLGSFYLWPPHLLTLFRCTSQHITGFFTFLSNFLTKSLGKNILHYPYMLNSHKPCLLFYLCLLKLSTLEIKKKLLEFCSPNWRIFKHFLFHIIIIYENIIMLF